MVWQTKMMQLQPLSLAIRPLAAPGALPGFCSVQLAALEELCFTCLG